MQIDKPRECWAIDKLRSNFCHPQDFNKREREREIKLQMTKKIFYLFICGICDFISICCGGIGAIMIGLGFFVYFVNLVVFTLIHDMCQCICGNPENCQGMPSLMDFDEESEKGKKFLFWFIFCS